MAKGCRGRGQGDDWRRLGHWGLQDVVARAYICVLVGV